MTDKTDEILNQLISGNKQLETDVAELKADVAMLKTDVAVIKANVSVIKANVSVIKTDVAVIKADVAEIKEGQQRIELFLLNMENRIMLIINAIYENSIMNKEQIEQLNKTQSKHSEKLETHELRILKLEHSKH